VAIIRYLARESVIPESLYPADCQQQARVDEFLEWHHIGLRLPLSMYFRVAINVFLPGMAGFDPADKYDNIAAWWPRVRAHFSPFYEEAHVTLNKIVAKNNKVKSKI
ncbi:Glutathione S-transferase theta 1, partial [Operophtera brumata]